MKRWIILLVAVCISFPAVVVVAEGADGEARSVKSGKSNSDNRSGAAAADEDAAGMHVKGSKSNTSERATSVRSGKNNADHTGAGTGSTGDHATSVQSGKSNGDN